MKKRILSMLLVLVMVLGLLPVGVMAAEPPAPQAATAKVSFTAQAAGGFLCAPQFGVEVRSDLAESYGYTDQVANGVSALDVLVKAHEVIFEDDFTAETAEDCLAVNSSGWITTVFGEPTSNFSFAVDGEYPCDRSGEYGQYGYTGYTIDQAPVKNNGEVEFFLYQDTPYGRAHQGAGR